MAPWNDILFAMHIHRDHGMVDEFEQACDHHAERMKSIIQRGTYLQVFGWIQWVLRRKDCPAMFVVGIDQALEEGRAAYRIVDGDTIMPIGSQAELETVQQAFADLAATEFHGARQHLCRAAEELSTRKIPDSIRESIHAVESVVRVLEPDGDFSKALARLETKANIHGALNRGFKSIYGFTCDENGIRHPLLDDPNAKVDETDALFMIGACAAFVSYLINKARGAGLLG